MRLQFKATLLLAALSCALASNSGSSSEDAAPGILPIQDANAPSPSGETNLPQELDQQWCLTKACNTLVSKRPEAGIRKLALYGFIVLWYIFFFLSYLYPSYNSIESRISSTTKDKLYFDFNGENALQHCYKDLLGHDYRQPGGIPGLGTVFSEDYGNCLMQNSCAERTYIIVQGPPPQ